MGYSRADRALRQARERFVSTTQLDGQVREEIAASWRRSVSHGIMPDRLTVPYQTSVDGGRLERAARPVADQLSEDLTGTGVSLVLSDERALIIDRRVPDQELRAQFDRIPLAAGCHFGEESIGTNALGMALRQESAALVMGEEHFNDTLAALMCSAAPIIDPATGRMLGAVGLTARARDDSSLMVPFVRRAAREVEGRLVDGISVADRVLFEHFLRARRRAKGPLVSVNERIMHANTAAAGLTSAADRAPLWDWATRVLAGAAPGTSTLRLVGGAEVTARARAVRDSDLLAGALIRLDPDPHPLATAGPTPGGSGGGPAPGGSAGRSALRGRAKDEVAFGWDGLTPTERSVAAVVAEGATNREAAARLYLSPHTVDFHLRQIFRKLGIGSRVELAGLVVRHAAGPGLAAAARRQDRQAVPAVPCASDPITAPMSWWLRYTATCHCPSCRRSRNAERSVSVSAAAAAAAAACGPNCTAQRVSTRVCRSSSGVSRISVSVVPVAPIEPNRRSRAGSARKNASLGTHTARAGSRLRNWSPNNSASTVVSRAFAACSNCSKKARTSGRTLAEGMALL
jgi:DNA-binding CsgD family transcriptional regulator